jgi:D-arabinose 1-dehydrogenase-like Zn-dependent alcohol dehydrogenase
VRVALAMEPGGIDSLELGDQPDPAPAAGQALIKVHGASIGPWDVGFLSGGFPGFALPFVPGQEIAGVVEAAGDGAGVHPGERVYASLFPAGGGFAELASADRLAPMPGQVSFQEAAALVIGAGTAYEGLDELGRLQAGGTVLITAAAGSVGSAAVQADVQRREMFEETRDAGGYRSEVSAMGREQVRRLDLNLLLAFEALIGGFDRGVRLLRGAGVRRFPAAARPGVRVALRTPALFR